VELTPPGTPLPLQVPPPGRRAADPVRQFGVITCHRSH